MTNVCCPICSSPTQVAAELVILRRHERPLLRCGECGQCFFDSPDWLDEAYEQSIASTDVGLVDRSIRLANVTTSYLMRYPANGPCLDFAAGTGMMVRLLRDRGFDFRYFDAYGPNRFAAGFEVDALPPARFQMVTAIEVAEHLVDPIPTFQRLGQLSDTILFTTQLIPGSGAPSADWPYLSVETGQHVSFYTSRSLHLVARSLGMHVVSRGDMHLMSKRRVSAMTWRAITTAATGQALAMTRRRRSLLPADHALAIERRERSSTAR